MSNYKNISLPFNKPSQPHNVGNAVPAIQFEPTFFNPGISTCKQRCNLTTIPFRLRPI